MVMFRGEIVLLLYKDEILEKIQKHFPQIDDSVVEIIVFGSVARNTHSPLSDIDMLLVTENKEKTKRLFSKFIQKIYEDTFVVISVLYLESPKDNRCN